MVTKPSSELRPWLGLSSTNKQVNESLSDVFLNESGRGNVFTLNSKNGLLGNLNSVITLK